MEEKKKKVTIRNLYPDLSEEELEEVKACLHAYAAIVWRVVERLEKEGNLSEGIEPDESQ
jgi:hypothetical protein